MTQRFSDKDSMQSTGIEDCRWSKGLVRKIASKVLKITDDAKVFTHNNEDGNEPNVHDDHNKLAILVIVTPFSIKKKKN